MWKPLRAWISIPRWIRLTVSSTAGSSAPRMRSATSGLACTTTESPAITDASRRIWRRISYAMVLALLV